MMIPPMVGTLALFCISSLSFWLSNSGMSPILSLTRARMTGGAISDGSEEGQQQGDGGAEQWVLVRVMPALAKSNCNIW